MGHPGTWSSVYWLSDGLQSKVLWGWPRHRGYDLAAGCLCESLWLLQLSKWRCRPLSPPGGAGGLAVPAIFHKVLLEKAAADTPSWPHSPVTKARWAPKRAPAEPNFHCANLPEVSWTKIILPLVSPEPTGRRNPGINQIWAKKPEKRTSPTFWRIQYNGFLCKEVANFSGSKCY